jgi:hypothetical protein
LLIVFVIALGLIPALTLLAQQRGETFAWAPVPVNNPGWIAPNMCKLISGICAISGRV